MLVSKDINFDSLLRLDGNDQVKMHAALRGWMDLAHEQRALLWHFTIYPKCSRYKTFRVWKVR